MKARLKRKVSEMAGKDATIYFHFSFNLIRLISKREETGAI